MVTPALLFLALLSLAGSLLLLRREKRLRAEAERAAETRTALLRRILELSLDAICEFDAEGRFTTVSPACERIWGYRPEELIGTPYIDKVLPEDRPRTLREAERIMAGSATTHFENRYVRKDGSIAQILWAARWSESERVMMCAARDASERFRMLEEAERQARILRRLAGELAVAKERAEAADRTKSAFLATMSHELRTPLNSILGFVGVLLQGLAGPLTAEQSKQLGMVRVSARHLLALINDVLDISKIEAGEMQVHAAPFDLRAAVEKVVESVRSSFEKKGLALTVEVAEGTAGLEAFPADQRRVEQILLNLLSNAAKFTEQGGATVSLCRLADEVEITVTDTGAGIRKEDLPTLFKPFRQIDSGLGRSLEGTGLGLAICSKLAALMGGAVTVTSELGKGSAFSLRLPVPKESVR